MHHSTDRIAHRLPRPLLHQLWSTGWNEIAKKGEHTRYTTSNTDAVTALGGVYSYL